MLQILSSGRAFAGANPYLVKLTLLVEGVYYHPVYGRMDYSAQVLKQIKEYHDRDVLGYRIPLYLGHETESGGERPAVGYLLPGGMTLEADEQGKLRLFGIFELVRQDVYEQIWRGEYSYGSAELVVEGLVDKTTGEPLGPVLVAHTLTCTPFIPDMLPNQALSSSPVTRKGRGETRPLYFTLLMEKTMAEQVDKMEKSLKEDAKSTDVALGLVNEAFAAYREEAERRIQELSARCDELQQQLQSVLAEKRQAELEALVKELQSLNLPSALKEKYIPLIRENSLTEKELALTMDNLRTISQHMGGLMFQQFGMAGATPEQMEKNPFEHIIEANRKQKESLRQV
jgi:hypothetical protein